jgi:hypothetical protein
LWFGLCRVVVIVGPAPAANDMLAHVTRQQVVQVAQLFLREKVGMRLFVQVLYFICSTYMA